jgi:rhodanese-related sulfurtransferase
MAGTGLQSAELCLMRTFFLLLVFLPTLILKTGPDGDHLEVKAFKAAVDKYDALLIDVRTPDEFAEGHIEGAANLDWTNGDLLKDVSGIDKTRPVLLCGGVDGRSSEALAAMKKAGFTDVHDLKGGFIAWKEDGQPFITQ